MEPSKNNEDAAAPSFKVQSVAAGILGEFFDELQKEEGLEEVAPRLRKLILGDGIFLEAAVRVALFQETT